MKIVGKAKRDYYDSCVAFGVDEGQVLVRNPTTHPLPELDVRIKTYSLSFKEGEQHYKGELLFFCGKVYPYLREYVTIFNTIDRRWEELVYDKIQNKHYFSYKDVLESGGTLSSHWELLWWAAERVTAKDWLRGVCSQKDIDTLTTLSHTLQCPYFLVSEHEVKTYPSLLDMGFVREVDPYTCFSEIERYYFGVLAGGREVLTDVPDSCKMERKGFDTKYGFKKRPVSKNPKRKNTKK